MHQICIGFCVILSIFDGCFSHTFYREGQEDFKKQTDSGVYTCAAMNSNKLFFGEPMEIKGEPDPATPPPKMDPAPPKTTTTGDYNKITVPEAQHQP